jgi:DNA-binding transcriptional LysR family regulator
MARGGAAEAFADGRCGGEDAGNVAGADADADAGALGAPPPPSRSRLRASARSFSPARSRFRGTPAAPGDLARHDCLHYLRPGDAPAWQLTPVGGESAAKVTVPVAGPFAANNSEALREAALAGLGIALLPDFSAQAALRAGKFVRVLPGWQPVGSFGEQLYAIRPYSPYVPRAVQALVAHLRLGLQAGFGEQ